MIDLTSVCGLNVMLDEETGQLVVNDEESFERVVEIALQEIIPVLLNKFLRYPEKVYKQHVKSFNVSEKNKVINYSIMQIPFGLLGIEFIKTHVYFSDYDKDRYASFVEVISGEVTMIIQRNREDDGYSFNTCVDSVEIIKLTDGERLAIPAGIFYTFVNTGSQQTIVAVVTSEKTSPVDYAKIQRERGLAYFIISKNARLEVVANPKYRLECDPVHSFWKDLDQETKQKYWNPFLEEKQPLYNIVSGHVQELAEIFV